MRKRVVVAGVVLAALAVAGAAGVAVYLLREPPQGELVDPTDVTVVTPTETVPPAPPPEPPPPSVDQRCWEMFGGDPARSLARPGIDLGVPRRRAMWARGLRSYIEYPASYCDGVLYVNTFVGDTWAVEAATGKVLWRRRDDAHKPSTPAIAGDRLIVGAKDGTVSALRRSDGKVLWQIRTGAIVESSPAVVDDTAYFGTTDGRLYAVATSNGRVRWAYDTGGRINSSPSIAEGRICITTYAGSVFCLRRATGEKLWSTYVKRDSFRYESFYASASTDGRRLYTIARSGRVVTLDARTGDVLWTRQQGGYGYSTPAVGADRIFVGGFDGALRAYRKTDGEELWRAAVGGRVLGAPVLVGDLVFFSTLETETYAARASDGKVVWHLGMGKYSPGIATERAYYFTLNGILVAFRGRDAPD